MPGGDFSIAGVPDFPDQKEISLYAVEAAKYMSKLEIIKGDGKGNFMPKATTTAQQAAGYGMATREAVVIMSSRTSEKLGGIPKASAPDAGHAFELPPSNRRGRSFLGRRPAFPFACALCPVL
ncbi:MAG: S-layer homology domain-containing protein [Peptococcaceae bacterium]|nr:S-layer homology domain-containing protein [Peptococcaceae bacterium]